MEPLHLFSLIFLCFLLDVSFSDIAADRAALINFSSAVRGNTLRWNSSVPNPCSWRGVSCDNVTNRVTGLSLPGARLAGQIPLNSIGNLTQLTRLSLRGNLLSGGIPSDIEFCSELRFIYLQNNNFSGEIPASFFRLSNLNRVDISGNDFSGEISANFNNLTRLTLLHLENNQFTGQIPDLNNGFQQFNVSMNRLTGRIPSRFANFQADSFTGNELCGPPLNSCPNDDESSGLSNGAIAGIAVASAVGSVLIIGAIFFLCRKFNRSRNSSQAVQDAASSIPTSSIPASPEKPPEYDFRSPDHIMAGDNTGSDEGYSGNKMDELTFFGQGGFLLDDLLRASAEMLGKGTVGTTYKAYLNDGGPVIVKRLKNVCVSKKDFTNRIVCLGELYHENLLPIRGYYYGKEEKLLVFDFISMGSLALVLHRNMEERSPLTWEIRIRIALQVSSGLEHLHSRNLSHGNIKANNILLTENFQASVSESGLIPLVSSSTPNLSGYRAPEVIDNRVATREADVYGFGILLLELLTGRDPTELLNEEGVDLPTWIQTVDEGRWSKDVFDHNLVVDSNNEEKMIRLLHLGIRCSSPVPSRRNSMREVSQRIKKICKI